MPRYDREDDTPEYWAKSMTGLDSKHCPIRAYISGERLAVQHGDNPEAVLFLTFEELNDDDCSGLQRFARWCEAIHEYESQGTP